MTAQPLPTQQEIQEKLVWLGQEMRRAKDRLRETMVTRAEKQKQATLIEAEAFITAEGSMDLRKWKAREAAADAQFEVGLAEAEVEGAKAALFNLRDELAAAQTLSADYRSEIRLEQATPNVPSSVAYMRPAS